MKRKSIIKIVIDISMTVLFPFLLFAFQTGLPFHEIAGIIIFSLFISHLFFNHSWIRNGSKNLFSGKAGKLFLFRYFFNMTLFIGFILITVTGLLISVIVIPSAGYHPTLIQLHKWSSYSVGILLLVHLSVHVKYVAGLVRAIGKSRKLPVIKNTLYASFAAVFLITAAAFYTISLVNKKYNAASQIENAEKKKDDDAKIKDPQATPATISEFLGNLFCSACYRHCPLSAPQCSRARPEIEKAKDDYQAIYGEKKPVSE